MDPLKLACEDQLSSTLEIDSVANILLLSDMHSANNLKLNCINFIVANLASVMCTESWEDIAKIRPGLLLQVCRDIALKSSNQKEVPSK